MLEELLHRTVETTEVEKLDITKVDSFQNRIFQDNSSYELRNNARLLNMNYVPQRKEGSRVEKGNR